MKYFEGITTITEADRKYRELAKKYHPDRGGDVEIMTQINLEYQELIENLTSVVTVQETTNIEVSKNKKKIKLTKETEIGLKRHGAKLTEHLFAAIFENLSSKYVERI